MSNAIKSNNVGLPADRRESHTPLAGAGPEAWAPLTGSGYDKAWSKPESKPDGAGQTSKSKGNGSW